MITLLFRPKFVKQRFVHFRRFHKHLVRIYRTFKQLKKCLYLDFFQINKSGGCPVLMMTHSCRGARIAHWGPGSPWPANPVSFHPFSSPWPGHPGSRPALLIFSTMVLVLQIHDSVFPLLKRKRFGNNELKTKHIRIFLNISGLFIKVILFYQHWFNKYIYNEQT